MARRGHPRPLVVDRGEQELYRLNDLVKSYLEGVKRYQSRLTTFVELVESALSPEGHQVDLFRQFVEEVDKSCQMMPRTILDPRLLPLSSEEVKAFLNGVMLRTTEAFKNCFAYYRAFIEDCLDRLDMEIKRIDAEIVRRNMTENVRITRAYFQARQMIQDMVYRLHGYEDELPLFDEFWIAVTEAHEEIRNVWKIMRLNRKITELEDYLGYPLEEAWTSHVRSYRFSIPNLLNEVEE